MFRTLYKFMEKNKYKPISVLLRNVIFNVFNAVHILFSKNISW